MKSDRKVILYIAMSLDGYIAKRDDDLGFLSVVEDEGQDYGYNDFTKTTDIVIIGRRTYDKVISMGISNPHPDKQTYVISRTSKPCSGNIEYYSKSLPGLISNLRSKPGKNIYLDGGSLLVNALLKLDLIDEFIISVIPIILGNGIPLFKRGRPEMRIKLVESKSFKKGLVQLHYARQEL